MKVYFTKSFAQVVFAVSFLAAMSLETYAGTPVLANPSISSSTETFTTSANFSTSGSAPTSVYWSPSSCSMKYFSTGGCTGGYVGYTGSYNNYFGCFLRSPAYNFSGSSQVMLNFDISNSYIASHIQSSPSNSDAVRFYMWIDNGYKSATSVQIDGVEKGQSDLNGLWLKFDELRSCVNVNVTFDLSTSVNLSSILFYIEPHCEFNDSYPYSVVLDNISFLDFTLSPLGVSEPKKDAGLYIYPNPVKENLLIKSTTEIKNGRVAIMNVFGQEVYSEQLLNVSNDFKVQVPVTLTTGIYFVQVKGENGQWTGKFLKE